MLIIDKYAYTNDLRDKSPQAKIIFACVGLFIIRLINNPYLYLINMILCLALIIRAKIRPRDYFKFFKLPMFFLVLSLIMILISIDDKNYLYYISLFNRKIGITEETLRTSLILFLAVMSSLSSIYFLVLTTPMNNIIQVLNRLGLPNLFIELMVLIYRSIFIFLDELKNLDLALTLKFGYETRRTSLEGISLIIGNLFRKIISKHSEMSIALECKLYDGSFKVGE